MVEMNYPYQTQAGPSKTRRKLYVAAGIVCVVILVVVALFLSHKTQTATRQTAVSGSAHSAGTTSGAQSPSTDATPGTADSPNTGSSTVPTGTAEQNAAFAQSLFEDDNPIGMQYTVISSSQPVPGWYVVIVDAHNEYGTFRQRAIIRPGSDNGDGGDVVAGPSEGFPISFLRSEGVPEAVINEVPTYAN